MLPVLKDVPAKRLKETGLAMSTVKAARNGHTIPHERNQLALIQAAAVFAREQLQRRGVEEPADDLASCAVSLASKSSLKTR